MKIKILGISGSPRRANTDFLVKEALKAAEESVQGDIETEFIHLADYKIGPCKACDRCIKEHDRKLFCPTNNDDMEKLLPKLLEADGVILGSPVYWGTVSGQLKIFMDRTRPLCRYGDFKYPMPWQKKFPYGMYNKIGGAITVGGERHGGQESAIHTIHDYFFIQGMIPSSTGSMKKPVCYLGGCGTIQLERKPAPISGESVRDVTKYDEYGLKSVRGLGQRITKLARAMKKIHMEELK